MFTHGAPRSSQGPVLKCPCIPGSNWNLEMLLFKERGKPGYPEKNLPKQSREPTTNSPHIWKRGRELNPALTTAPTLLPCNHLLGYFYRWKHTVLHVQLPKIYNVFQMTQDHKIWLLVLINKYLSDSFVNVNYFYTSNVVCYLTEIRNSDSVIIFTGKTRNKCKPLVLGFNKCWFCRTAMRKSSIILKKNSYWLLCIC